MRRMTAASTCVLGDCISLLTCWIWLKMSHRTTVQMLKRPHLQGDVHMFFVCFFQDGPVLRGG